MKRSVSTLGLLLLLPCAAWAQAVSTKAAAPGPDPYKARIEAEVSATPAASANLQAITGQAVACRADQAAGFPCGQIDLLSFLPLADLGGGANVNDIWGWTDPETSREYVVIGRSDGTSFVDITDPVNPVYLGNLPTHTGPRLWRDVKVVNDHAFIVSEAAGHGMQVFDLRQLRNVGQMPVQFEATAHYDRFAAAHNIVISEDERYVYAVGMNGLQTPNCGPGMHIVNIESPEAPVFEGCVASWLSQRNYVHDAQCVLYRGPDARYQGQEICFNSEENVFVIVDVTDKQRVQPLSAQAHPGAVYIHQGWLSEDHRYFFLDDELDERTTGGPTKTLIWDVSDLEDPVLVKTFFGANASIDHNQYVNGRYLYQANYTTGLRILDIIDPENPQEVAFFDTYQPDNGLTYSGAWSIYPYFESGVIAVSSIGEGLFLLRPTLELNVSTGDEPDVPQADRLTAAYPNPFNPQTTFNLILSTAQEVRVAVYDAAGREVERLHDGWLEAGTHAFTFAPSASLPSGVYWYRAEGPSLQQTRSFTLLK